jgi:hypothetical protein
MPSRHGTGPYANWRHDISYQTRPQVAAREGATRIARVSFAYGLASEAQLRPASCMASCCDAVNNRGSAWVSVLEKMSVSLISRISDGPNKKSNEKSSRQCRHLTRSALSLPIFDGHDSSWLVCYRGRATKQQRVALRESVPSGKHKDRLRWGFGGSSTNGTNLQHTESWAAANPQLDAIEYCRGDRVQQTRADSAAFVIR